MDHPRFLASFQLGYFAGLFVALIPDGRVWIPLMAVAYLAACIVEHRRSVRQNERDAIQQRLD